MRLLIFVIQAEHIDNPRGYGGGEDPRNYDRRLRGPVDVSTLGLLIRVGPVPLNDLSQPRELEVDPRTGMKNYIANGKCDDPHQCSALTCSGAENGPWDTSKALVRRTLERCIHIGRQYRSQGRKEDQYEAYRLLGQSVCSITSEFLICQAHRWALSSCTPSKTSLHIQIFVSLLLFRWATPMYSCTSATMCVSRPPTADGSPLWSPDHSDPAISYTAC